MPFMPLMFAYWGSGSPFPSGRIRPPTLSTAWAGAGWKTPFTLRDFAAMAQSLLGDFVQVRAMAQTSQAVKALLKLAPNLAWRLRDDGRGAGAARNGAGGVGCASSRSREGGRFHCRVTFVFLKGAP